jgi:hypothetical protein
MIQISEEELWDAASVGIDIMALLAGSAIVALLVALLAIWLIALPEAITDHRQRTCRGRPCEN